MIMCIGRGTAALANAANYQRHFRDAVVPEPGRLAGHRGVNLLRCVAGEQVEFLAVTLWDSLDAVKAFAGADPGVAVVEPAAAALAEYDRFARHYEVVVDTHASGSGLNNLPIGYLTN
jgi:heme-degrading monooxygenase HmoA